LTPNPDILASVADNPDRPQLVIGFAAESEQVEAYAQRKRARKKLDLIVANDVSAADAGFEADTNRVLFISAGGVKTLPLMAKAEVATRLISWITAALRPSLS
jgi:phosphopantothenoylcysteine decarboxylase/phosphopantothenate--cysteine ligase